MNVAYRKPMTLETFLDWERRQELRWEFDGIAPVAMNGVTIEHSVITTNLILALRERLHGMPFRAYGMPFRAFGSGVKIVVDGRVRYPDAVVTCPSIPRGVDIVPKPMMVFEVLSPSTAVVDRVAKNAEYRATASIRRYVMLEQDSQAATMFARDGEAWVGQLVVGDEELALPELGLTIPLAELYIGVELADEE